MVFKSFFESLSAYGDTYGLVADDFPSRSAFSQARRRLGHQAVLDAFFRIRDTCTTARRVNSTLFYGKRLASIDGTGLNLPPSPELSK